MRFLPFVAIAAVTGACLPRALEQPVAEQPTPSPTLPAPNPDRVAPRAASGRAMSAAQEPRLVVERVEGADPQRVRQAFARVPEHVRECAPQGASVLRMRLQSDASAVSIVLEPGLSSSPELRRCVLEALSAVDIDNVGSRSSPSNRPSGFTALVRVEW